ncbi:MAG TPA: hypothetical protein ENN58_01340, partial [bacterium]|nr:hypothetical protein [bacterium]
MGLIKGITDAVLQKAKNEMKEYILKVMEEESTEKEDQTDISISEIEEDDSQGEDFDVEEAFEEEEDDENEDILSLIEEDIVRLTFKTRPGDVSLPKKIVEILQFLSFYEFAVYLKLFIFCCDQKKNYGYLGNTLRKKTGLIEMESEEFNKIIDRLSKYGLI